MSEELKITKERIKKLVDGLSSCPEARDAVKDAFPEAFEEEKQWVDITKEIEWKLHSLDDSTFWVRGYYEDQVVVWLDTDGISSYGLTEIKIEKEDMSFRILKKT